MHYVRVCDFVAMPGHHRQRFFAAVATTLPRRCVAFFAAGRLLFEVWLRMYGIWFRMCILLPDRASQRRLKVILEAQQVQQRFKCSEYLLDQIRMTHGCTTALGCRVCSLLQGFHSGFTSSRDATHSFRTARVDVDDSVFGVFVSRQVSVESVMIVLGAVSWLSSGKVQHPCVQDFRPMPFATSPGHAEL